MSLVNMVYYKGCHLPLELEHKSYRADKFHDKLLNMDYNRARKKRLLQLEEMDEWHLEAYESDEMYKQKMKYFHDKKIFKREFKTG